MISDSDYKTLEDINVTLNSISLLGTSFIIVTYILSLLHKSNSIILQKHELFNNHI